MGASRVVHPSADVLRALALGKLDDATAAKVRNHADSCPACREKVAAANPTLSRSRPPHDSAATQVPADSLPETGPRPQPAPGPTPLANLPPELADNPDYEVLRELGRGGMGVVYQARHKLSGRLEVLKVMNKALIGQPDSRERFLREIQSAARLDHRNVVKMHTAIERGELMVLVMEYVEGEDLARVLKACGSLQVLNACYYVQQAATGLQHAHEKGMVHRDIKPQNLMLIREGKKHTVKVLDFGLAKATHSESVDAGLTGTGAMMGSPGYIAPEQSLDAAKADIRADVYSLGCTLYHLLAGAPPFSGRSVFEIVQAHHSKEARSLSQIRPEVPEELAAVVGKMMAKDPAARYQTPAEVVRALDPFIKGGPKPPPTLVPVKPNPGVVEVPAIEKTLLAPLAEIVSTPLPTRPVPTAERGPGHGGPPLVIPEPRREEPVLLSASRTPEDARRTRTLLAVSLGLLLMLAGLAVLCVVIVVIALRDPRGKKETVAAAERKAPTPANPGGVSPVPLTPPRPKAEDPRPKDRPEPPVTPAPVKPPETPETPVEPPEPPVKPPELIPGTYTLKIKPSAAGDVTRWDRQADMNVRVAVGGMEVGTGAMNATVNQTYKETILEKPLFGDATKSRREYTKALLKQNNEEKPLSYRGKTVLVEKKEGKYHFTTEEGQEYTGTDANWLNASGMGIESMKALFPRRPVGVNETWKIDPETFFKANNPLASQAFPLDSVKGTATGKLMRVYEQGGRQFGVLEFRIDVSLEGEFGADKGKKVTFLTGSKLSLFLGMVACIDGTSGDSETRMTADCDLIMLEQGNRITIHLKMNSKDTAKDLSPK